MTDPIQFTGTREEFLAKVREMMTEETPWQTMDSAPLDGKHCILAVPESGGFIYNVQGAYQDGQWNCVHRDNVQPLYWMPNFRLPEGWQHVQALSKAALQTPHKAKTP